jgi:putative FmdB family regulatory protein
MPLYVYACPTCELEVEELRPISRADDPASCPVCHDTLSRAVTTFSLGGRSAAPGKGEGATALTAPRHAAGCACCAPRQLTKTPPPIKK